MMRSERSRKRTESIAVGVSVHRLLHAGIPLDVADIGGDILKMNFSVEVNM